MEELRTYLQSILPGPVQDTEQMQVKLRNCWHEFSGGTAESMTADKLVGRMEDVMWDPPLIEFVIERHGGTVQGSSRAERHLWTVNLTTRAATCKRIGHRQLRPMAKKLDVRPVAEAIVQLILAGAPDERLKWNVAGDVRVQIGKILPAESAATQTVTARRKRLRTAIDELLEEAGWQKLRENVFRPPGTT